MSALHLPRKFFFIGTEKKPLINNEVSSDMCTEKINHLHYVGYSPFPFGEIIWDNFFLVCISQECTYILMSLIVGQSLIPFVKPGPPLWLFLWDTSVCFQKTTKSYFLEQGTGIFLHLLLQATFSLVPQEMLSFSKLLSRHLGAKSKDTCLHSLNFFPGLAGEGCRCVGEVTDTKSSYRSWELKYFSPV